MTNQNITLTDEILAGMLTENTGRHMMDSGGAYGRNWERNQGLDVQAFIDRPAITVTEWGIDLDLFHFLRERVEFNPDVQAEFDEWVEQQGDDDNWYSLMEEWCELHSNPYHRDGSFNSYNGDCLLSQTIQGSFFEYNGETMLILQIHGGADVRGGYTAPKVFGFGYYVEPYSIFEWDSYVVQSADDRKGEPVCLQFRSGDICDLMDNGEYIGDGYGLNKDEDRHPLLDWFDGSKCEWDEDAKAFIAPDGDGHIEYVPMEV